MLNETNAVTVANSFVEPSIQFTELHSVGNRRRQRSQVVSKALTFQCAHVRDDLSLEAMVITDHQGDRWVGAGDRALCRLLSRSAPDLARRGTERAALRLAAIRALEPGIESNQITTCAIRVPGSDASIFVTGVGDNSLRTTGVLGAATGVKRILGYEKPRASQVGTDEDPDVILQRIVDQCFARLTSAGAFFGVKPPSILGFVDDTVYRETLGHLLAPAIEAIVHSGVIVDDLWRNYRFRSTERLWVEGTHIRTFKSPLREARSGAKLGEMVVHFYHDHDRFAVPYCPRIRIQWS